MNIRLSPPSESAKSDAIAALVDTGSDFSLAPLRWLLQIDAPEVGTAFVRGLWSKRQQVTLCLIDIHLQQGWLPGVEIIGVPENDLEAEEQEEIILGRNVLNKLILLLDGPHMQTDVLERRPVRL